MQTSSSKTSQDLRINRVAETLRRIWLEFTKSFSYVKNRKELFLFVCTSAALAKEGVLPLYLSSMQMLEQCNSWLSRFGIKLCTDFQNLDNSILSEFQSRIQEVLKSNKTETFDILSIAYETASQMENAKSGVHLTDRDTAKFICKLALSSYLAQRNANSFLNALEIISNPSQPLESQDILEQLSRARFLDPAAGTGIFIHGLIDTISELQVLNNQKCKMLIETALSNFSAVEVDPTGLSILRIGLLIRFQDDPTIAARPSLYCADYLASNVAAAIGPVDVVLGNPPYIRNERIGGGLREIAVGSSYKHLLLGKFRHDFREVKLDYGADLYVYFILRAFRQLDTSGSLAFITSNSWLDSNYGESLQDWLLANAKITLVANIVARSFSAEIDPVIIVLQRPQRFPVLGIESLDNVTHFVTTLTADSTSFLKTATGKDDTAGMSSVVSIDQRHLFPKDTDKKTWLNHKWGGRFLRAPKVYSEIFEGNADLFVPLNFVALVKSGVHSRANDFFILRDNLEDTGKPTTVISRLCPGEPLDINRNFLRPIIASQKYHPAIKVLNSEYNLFAIPSDASHDPAVAKYLKIAIENGVDTRPELGRVADRKNGIRKWFQPVIKVPGPIVVPKIIRDKHRVHYNPGLLLADGNFYSIVPGDNECTRGLLLYLNSTLSILSMEVLARTNVLGILKVEGRDWNILPVPPKEKLIQIGHKYRLFEQFTNRPIKLLHQETYFEDRRMLDQLILNVLGLDCTTSYIYDGVLRLRTLRSLKEQRTR